MKDVYESLLKDLAGFIEKEDTEMCLIVLLALQEIRLYINYSVQTWSDEELRNLMRDVTSLLEPDHA